MKRIFPKLTKQIGLKEPNLEADEYEVLIWYRQGLRFGDAQAVYVLHKTEKLFTVVKYIIDSNQRGFQSAKRWKPTVTTTLALWQRLLKQNILTLPNESTVFDRLYPKSRPSPPVDTVQTGMQADGSFTVKGYRTERRRSLFTDGDSYSFELFGPNNYRVYSYSNPDAYLRDEPKCEELQNVVGILNDLNLLFRSDKLGKEQAKAINKD
ncbi:hypothetical protein [Spirosoma pollinicola]|uniref:hypothetical protein n=1 Tax=Spirosoma pollinicola TaxID=2057025 RepID=UPI001981F70E|nr:hypothetical protein [Spirosoma pollinicola]